MVSLICLEAVHARTWTNTEGREIEAEFLGFDAEAGVVAMAVAGGRTYSVPLDTLSEADQAWVRERHAESEALREGAGKMVSFTSKTDPSTPYHVYLPKDFDPEKPYPVVLLFSPGGNAKPVANMLREACDAAGWIAVGCDEFRNAAPEEEMTRRFEALLPEIRERLPVDPERLYLGGYTGGAARALVYANRFDVDWAGVLAMGTWKGERVEEFDNPLRVALVVKEGESHAEEWLDAHAKELRMKKGAAEAFRFPAERSDPTPEALTGALRWLAEGNQ